MFRPICEIGKLAILRMFGSYETRFELKRLLHEGSLLRPTKQFVQHLPMKHKGQGALRGNKACANVLTTQVRVSRPIRTPLLGLVVKIYIGHNLMHQHNMRGIEGFNLPNHAVGKSKSYL